MNNGKPVKRNPTVRKFRHRRRGSALPMVIALVISLIVIAIGVFALCRVLGIIDFGDLIIPSGDPKDTDPQSEDVTGGNPEDTDPRTDESNAPGTDPATDGETEPVTDAPGPLDGFELVPRSPDDSVYGSLVLVNADHEYTFPSDQVRVNTYEMRKSITFKLAFSDISIEEETFTQLQAMMREFYELYGRLDVELVGGFRTLEQQQTSFDKYGAGSVAKPGCSDHHTGLSFDIRVHDETGTKNLNSSALSEDYAWIYENCHRYGFILRYPSNKVSKTGCSYEPGHLRYVGVAHATYIHEHGICLEEYIDLLRAYTFSGEHLYIDTGDGEYEVFCVDSVTATVGIPISTALPCEVSGTNAGSFVVTLKLQ